MRPTKQKVNIFVFKWRDTRASVTDCTLDLSKLVAYSEVFRALPLEKIIALYPRASNRVKIIIEESLTLLLHTTALIRELNDPPNHTRMRFQDMNVSFEQGFRARIDYFEKKICWMFFKK